MVRRHEAITPAVERREEAFQIPFDVEEVHRRAVAAPLLGPARAHRQQAQALALFQPAVVAGEETHAALEQACAFLLAIEVVGRGAQQPRPERGAHHAEVGGDGIGQRQRLGRGVDFGLKGGVHKAVGHRLVVATLDQAIRQRLGVAALFRARRDARGVRGMGTRRTVVAVHPRHLFDEVFFAQEVVAPARHAGPPARGIRLHIQSEALQQGLDLAIRRGIAEQTPQTLTAQGDVGGGRQMLGRDVIVGGPGVATADGGDQGRGPLQRDRRQFGVDAAFEAVGGV